MGTNRRSEPFCKFTPYPESAAAGKLNIFLKSLIGE